MAVGFKAVGDGKSVGGFLWKKEEGEKRKEKKRR